MDESEQVDVPESWGRVAPRDLFAWGWQTVNVAFTAHAEELRETGLRIPFRGLMLFLWHHAIQARPMHPNHLDTLLRDTGRLGTRGEVSQGLRDAILALHYLGRAGLASRAVEEPEPGEGTRAFFEENVLYSLQRAEAACPQAESDAASRLRGLVGES